MIVCAIAGGSNVPLLQKSLLSAELSLGLLSTKHAEKDKAFIQCLQKHVEVRNSCMIDINKLYLRLKFVVQHQIEYLM